jgi:OHCU decarboxylase
MTESSFVENFGSLFESSPWIAAQTWPRRPFGSREELLREFVATLRRASREEQVALIRAHPDLAGRLAKLGQLTAESTIEQASAGLDRLSPEQAAQFEDFNNRYKSKFGFPFVICARLNDRTAILEAFARRLESTREVEIDTAIGEIEKIAALRLAPLVEP